MKKLFIAMLAIPMIVACSNSPKPEKDFYKISDENVIAYITESNNIESCLPSGMRLISLNEAERRVLNGIKLDVLKNLIGSSFANNVWFISEYYGGDKQANAYFEQKVKELAHKNTNVNKSECSLMKAQFKERLNDYIAEVQYENSAEGRARRAALQQQGMAFFGMIHQMGNQAQQPSQLDYLQQLELEKARSKKRTRITNTDCHRIGSDISCNSVSY